ncbi:MAG: transcriptional regulator [Phascolarctobacterium sp.]|nr:MAG: transcriptional regulator [Phascolarctobacterium sp.]
MKQDLDRRYFMPSALQVVPDDNFGVYVYCNDGTVRYYNAKHLLKPGTVFEPLMDLKEFKNRLTVINNTIAWDMTGDRDESKCVDLDPCMLLELPIVSDPLEIKEKTA